MPTFNQLVRKGREVLVTKSMIVSDEIPVIHRMMTIVQRLAEMREWPCRINYLIIGKVHSLWDALHADSAGSCMESVIFT